MHRGLRQLTNTHKALSDEIRAHEKAADRAAAATRLEAYAAQSWRSARRGEADVPPDVEVVSTPLEAAVLRKEGVLAFEQAHIGAAQPIAGRGGREAAERRNQMRSATCI